MSAGKTMTNSTETIQEELEGLDNNVGAGEYPLNSVFVRPEQRTVKEIVERIRKNRYTLNPDFQRDFVWKPDKQSRLIESCLMRIPLPVFYVAQDKEGRIVVVDGLQRLTTFYRFLNNEFALKLNNTEVEDGHTLQGKRFKELPLVLQERIEDTQLVLYILDEKAPERAKLDIFERVNGGELLTRQQMRNCLYNGKATIWLREMAKDKLFLEVTGESLNSKTMRDREAINRFCAFRLLGEEKYKGEMDQFLADALEAMNKLSDSELDNLTQAFKRSLEYNKELFGRHAFRKSIINDDEQTSGRSILNIALFDVCSVLFSQLEVVSSQKESLRQTMINLLNDEDFIGAISASTNSTKQVLTRFRLARAAFQEML
jgi:uncharacterized protein with ParB-like and HNH nuclease domain